MLANDQDAAKTIFSRCLLLYPNVELWNTYLRFIRNVNLSDGGFGTRNVVQINQSKGAESVIEIRRAFEFTLDRIGQDMNAGSIWQEYVNFLQSPKPGTAAYNALFSEEGAAAGQEDSHRIVILRSRRTPEVHTNMKFLEKRIRERL